MTPRVFVYGTLRPGAAAYRRVLAPYARAHRPATLDGFALYARGLPYPVAVRREGFRVKGDLVEIDRACLAEALAAMDIWEGDGYRRVEASVDTAPGPIPAWVYVAAEGVRLPDDALVRSGDWFEYLA